MEYSFDIFNKTPEHLAMVLAENCRKRRLDRGMSRRSLSETTGVYNLSWNIQLILEHKSTLYEVCYIAYYLLHLYESK